MVYVVQEQPDKNIVSAQKFGEIKILLPHGSNIMFSAGQATHNLVAKMSDFNDDDYLLLIGDPTAIGIATAVACMWNQGRVKLLKWDRQAAMYYPVQVNLYQKESDEVLN